MAPFHRPLPRLSPPPFPEVELGVCERAAKPDVCDPHGLQVVNAGFQNAKTIYPPPLARLKVDVVNVHFAWCCKSNLEFCAAGDTDVACSRSHVAAVDRRVAAAVDAGGAAGGGKVKVKLCPVASCKRDNCASNGCVGDFVDYPCNQGNCFVRFGKEETVVRFVRLVERQKMKNTK